VQDQVDRGSRGVEQEVRDGRGHAGHSRTGQFRGVDEHERTAAVELGHHRVEVGVAQIGAPVIGQQDHPVGPQVVVGMSDGGEGSVHIGQRQRREHAEPVGPVLDQLGVRRSGGRWG